MSVRIQYTIEFSQNSMQTAVRVGDNLLFRYRTKRRRRQRERSGGSDRAAELYWRSVPADTVAPGVPEARCPNETSISQ